MTTTTNPITFASLQLAEPLQRALIEKNYTEPSPIQAQCIPHLLTGGDLIGCAQTGTGKTAAFALPILHRLAANPRRSESRRCRALILTPTRELASQIEQSFATYGKHLRLSTAVIFGGVGIGGQIQKLHRGVDIVIATPGRLLDLANQNRIYFDQVEVLVLDEADRMLDMGFAPSVNRIIAMLPKQRQSLLFSATMPREIEQMAMAILKQPKRVEVTPVATTAEKIDQRVCIVDKEDKRKLLVHFLKAHTEGLVLVFVRMKHMANRLAEALAADGIRAEAIHGNKSQGARERALGNFRSGQSRVLIATDIAARGIDVKGISLVINFDIPEESESYVHRIGRTARAGAEGVAISFCDRNERSWLRNIERLIRMQIPVVKDHPFVRPESAMTELPPEVRRGGGGGGQRRGGSQPSYGRQGGNDRGFSRGGNAGGYGGGYAGGRSSGGGQGASRFSRAPRQAASN